MNETRAYSYIRFSNEIQKQGDSLRRQTQLAEDWCERNNIPLFDKGRYRDLGVSAFKGRHRKEGNLAVFLKLVEAGKIPSGSYLLVEALDRLSREDVLTALKQFIAIIEAGIIIVTLGDNQVYDATAIRGGNWTQLVVSISVMARSNEESARKSFRIRERWNQNRINATSGTPYTAHCPGWLRLSEDRQRWELIPERVKIVKRIFARNLQGAGVQAIARELNADKVPNFGKARLWTHQLVHKLLSNRAVLGEFRPGHYHTGQRTTCDPIQGYYPAIITEADFATAAQIRAGRGHKGQRQRTGRNPFSGLLFAKDGSRMTYALKGSRVSNGVRVQYHYLVPSSYYEQTPRPAYSAWAFDKFQVAFLEACREAALAKAPEKTSDNGELSIARQALADSEKRMARLWEFLESGESAGARERIRTLEAQQVELKSKIQDLETTASARPTRVDKVDWRDAEALRENLQATVRRIIVDTAHKSFEVEFMDGRRYTHTPIAAGTAAAKYVGGKLRRIEFTPKDGGKKVVRHYKKGARK